MAPLLWLVNVALRRGERCRRPGHLVLSGGLTRSLQYCSTA